jgi:ribosomal protein S4E
VCLQEEAAYKLLKVVRQQFGKGGVPYIATHDGRTIRYPDPDIKVLLRLSLISCGYSICTALLP